MEDTRICKEQKNEKIIVMIKYDFTAELTGTGDRSECDSGNYYESDMQFLIQIRT